MIQIMKFGQVPEEKIFARVVPEVDVEVRKNSTPDTPGEVVCQAKVRFN